MKSAQPMPADRKRPAPGDEAVPGTPGTGEDICTGTGKIIRGIGDA